MVSRGIVVACVMAAVVSGQAPQADPKKEVMAVVEGAIKLLTEKKHAEFIKTYMWPAEVERLTTRYGSVDKLAAEMAKSDERMAAMLKQLQTAAKLEPSFEGDGSIARFRFEQQVGRDSGLKLEKLNGRWYLRD
jgi:hypothetical protein